MEKKLSQQIVNLTKRADRSVDKGDWARAAAYAERVLEIDHQNEDASAILHTARRRLGTGRKLPEVPETQNDVETADD